MPLLWTQFMPLLEGGTSSNGNAGGSEAKARGIRVAAVALRSALMKLRLETILGENTEEDVSFLLTLDIVRINSESSELLLAFCDEWQTPGPHLPFGPPGSTL